MGRLMQFISTFVFMAFVSVASAKTAGVAATVNGQDILSEKLQKSVDAHLQQQGSNVGAIRDPKKYSALREKILDILIGQKLLWQSAKEADMVATDEEVDHLYKQFVSQYPNEDDFKTKMKIEGYTENAYREELRQQLSAKKWVHENVIKKIAVDDKDVHDFYVKNEERFQSPEYVRARHILITLAKDAGAKEKKSARKLLRKLKKELNKGADFAELARKHSKGPSAPQGGDLGFFPRGKMVKPFEDAVFKLKNGEVSDIVETQFGLHLIKLEERQAARKIEEAEVASRIQQYLIKTRSEDGLKEAIDKLKKTAKIEKHI